MTDLRYAIRMLRKSRGLAAAAIVSLGLGIGANSVIFSWVKAVLLYPLPGVARQGDLVAVATETRDGGYVGLSYPDYRDYRDRMTGRSTALSVTETTTFSLGAMSRAERAERLYGALVSGNYFDLIGVAAAHGRTFSVDDDRVPNGSPVAVISDGLWHRRFAGDPAMVGKTIAINGHPLTVVGVLPPTFQGTMVGIALDVWMPVMMQPQLLPGRRSARGAGCALAGGDGTAQRRRVDPVGAIRARDDRSSSDRRVSAQQRRVHAERIAALEISVGRAADARPGSHGADGRCRDRPSAGVRQCRQPAARSSAGAPPRSGDSTRDRCQPRPTGAPVPDREPAACHARRRRRIRHRADRRRRADSVHTAHRHPGEADDRRGCSACSRSPACSRWRLASSSASSPRCRALEPTWSPI